MKKQISSLDLHYLSRELQILEDSRLDNIYQPEKCSLVFQLYKSNAGKKMLNAIVGEAIFLIESREENLEPLDFCMLLRKHLGGMWLRKIRQIGSERILELEFGSKDESKRLYLEFFGRGNAVLCGKDGMIINSIEHHEFKDRKVMPKIKYAHPEMKYNFLNLKMEDLAEMLKSSKTESLVKCLAIELGFGGVYSEEICLSSDIDKGINPGDVEEKGIKRVYSAINNIINNKTDAKVILKNGEVVDVNPFELEFYRDFEKKGCNSFSEALNFFYSRFRPKAKSEYEKRMEKLQSRIHEQAGAIESLKKEGQELREKGEIIYYKYALISEILGEINKASSRLPWKEVKERLKNHKVVKEINEKDRKVVVEV